MIRRICRPNPRFQGLSCYTTTVHVLARNSRATQHTLPLQAPEAVGSSHAPGCNVIGSRRPKHGFKRGVATGLVTPVSLTTFKFRGWRTGRTAPPSRFYSTACFWKFVLAFQITPRQSCGGNVCNALIDMVHCQCRHPSC